MPFGMMAPQSAPFLSRAVRDLTITAKLVARYDDLVSEFLKLHKLMLHEGVPTQAIQVMWRKKEFEKVLQASPKASSARRSLATSYCETCDKLLKLAKVFEAGITDDEREQERRRLQTGPLKLIYDAMFEDDPQLASRLVTRKSKGRPASARANILTALDYKWQHPKVSWRQLADTFCEQEHEDHSLHCETNIRVQVQNLSKELIRLGCPDFLNWH
jgi:hypothetical protein